MKVNRLAALLLAGTLLFGNTLSAFAAEGDFTVTFTTGPMDMTAFKTLSYDSDDAVSITYNSENVQCIKVTLPEDQPVVSDGYFIGWVPKPGTYCYGLDGDSNVVKYTKGQKVYSSDGFIYVPLDFGGFMGVYNFSTPLDDYIDIPVENDTANGETITKFEVDNTILGGDLIVSIPAEMTLEYDSDKEVMTKLDYVSASGRCATNQKLEIRTLTAITYKDDNNADITVPGTVTFGVTEDDKQLENWTALELLTGVKTPDDIVKRDIAATVLKSDIDYVGSYSSLILYNITLVSTDSTTEEPPEEPPVVDEP